MIDQLSQPPAALVDEFRKYYGPTKNAFESLDEAYRVVWTNVISAIELGR